MKPHYTLLITALLSCSALTQAQLNGTYTVGGSAPDYMNITTAVNDLMLQGASGNVTFDIRPGLYTGNYVLNHLPGAGVVTFRSANGNAASVVLEHNATSDADNHIFLIDSLENVSIRDITMKALNSVFARAIVFRNDAENLTIDGCTIMGSENPTGGYYDANLIYCDQNTRPTSANPDGVTITNNTLINGHGGIRLDFKGTGGTRAQDLYINNNRLIDQTDHGIWIGFCRGEVSGNYITTSTSPEYRGFHSAYFANGARLEGNRIEGHSTGDIIGISFTNTQGTMDNVVRNNMVYVSAAGGAYGIQYVNHLETTITGNTFVCDGASPTASAAVYHYGNFAASNPTTLRNNIAVNYGVGPALKAKIQGNIGIASYNNLFAVGPDLVDWGDGILYGSLAAYQSGTGMGTGSLNFDPAFSILPDAHLNSCVLEGTGIADTLLTEDVDGDPRSATSPDMGADEFTFSSGTITAVPDTIFSSQTPYTLSAGNGSSFQWSTGATTQSIQITAGGTYNCTLTDVNGCSYSVDYPIHVILSTQLAENRNDCAITCWPNPTSDQLNISYGSSESLLLRVIDMTGRIMLIDRIAGPKVLDVSNWPNGFYLLDLGIHGHMRVLKE